LRSGSAEDMAMQGRNTRPDSESESNAGCQYSTPLCYLSHGIGTKGVNRRCLGVGFQIHCHLEAVMAQVARQYEDAGGCQYNPLPVHVHSLRI
jgi:hypothetical protein